MRRGEWGGGKWPPWWVIATAGFALVGTVVVIVYGYLARPGWFIENSSKIHREFIAVL
jgi:hypothetical protein